MKEIKDQLDRAEELLANIQRHAEIDFTRRIRDYFSSAERGRALQIYREEGSEII